MTDKNQPKPEEKGSLLPAGKSSSNPNVRVKTDALNVPERKQGQTVAPPPNPLMVTAPVVNFQIRDEIEMLRAGEKNVHGEVVGSESKQPTPTGKLNKK